MSTARDFRLIGRCNVAPSAEICHGAIIGKPFRPFLDGTRESGTVTRIDGRSYVGCYAIIGAGSAIKRGVLIDDFSIIESRVFIGAKSLIIYRAQICNDARIGDHCVIGGFVGERTQIGNKCRMFGKTVHLQHEPHKPWDADDVLEPAPIIKDGAFVGFGAIITGGITIGRKAYVCSGAIVSKNIPPKHIVYGVNQIVHFSKWPGRLKHSHFFRN